MKMYIDGAAADASNGEVIEVLNPATGELIDTVPSATQEDVSRAVTAAVAGEMPGRPCRCTGAWP